MKLPRPVRDYLWEIRGYVYLSAFLFGASVAGGYLYALLLPERAEAVFSTFQQVIAQRFGGMESGFIALAIFTNNLFATFIMLIFGLFFGFLPGAGLIFNGVILGVVSYMVMKESFLLLVSIIPHGVFEIPVFLVSAAIGLRLGHQVMRKVFLGGDARISEELKRGLYFYFRWGVPLLLAAAVIETYVSLRIAHYLR